MKLEEQQRLLEAILAGEDPPGLREATLELGLRALKARRARRRLLRCAGIAAFALALAAGLLWHELSSPPPQRGVLRSEVVAAPSPSPAVRVKFITDDELMALFPDRSVALIGKPGRQQLVFLDENRSPNNQR